MRNLMIAFIALSLFNVAFASDCEKLFTQGAKENQTGVAKVQQAEKTFEKAVKTYEAGKKKEGCKLLAQAMKEGKDSLKNFQACKAVFAKAVDICDPQNANVAQNNVHVCQQSIETVGHVLNYLKQVNSQYCK